MPPDEVLRCHLTKVLRCHLTNVAEQLIGALKWQQIPKTSVGTH